MVEQIPVGVAGRGFQVSDTAVEAAGEESEDRIGQMQQQSDTTSGTGTEDCP